MSRRSLFKTSLTGGAALVACAACCAPLLAPLVVPPIAALFAGGGAALAVGGQIVAGITLLAGALAFIGHRWWQARQRAEAASASACDCPPERGCGPGMCAMPDSPAGGGVG
jgi:hypothetical protein